ncbi:MAG: hypothetical protein IJD66_03060 [Methanocorpusculum sp.]|nr:hypothetical protein [Methanocorpusculum sp.]
MVSSGIFTTVGEAVYRNGVFSKNTQELAPLLNTSDASLYVAVSLPHSIIFGTLVNVQQKNSRPHAVIYLEECDAVSDIGREIFSFFRRCETTLASQEYTILPGNEFLLFCTSDTNHSLGTPSTPDILQYTYGRLSVGKSITCISKDYSQTIAYISDSIRNMPALLAADAVIVATRLGFGQADIIVSNSSDIQYQVNLDTMEIKGTESPEMYKQFASVYDNMSAADVQHAVKEQILFLYDKQEATNDDRKYKYYTFLQHEKISTNLLAIQYALSTMEIKKKDSKKGLISKIGFGKDKSTDKDKSLRVKLGGTTLHSGLDYSYDAESNVIFLNRKSFSVDTAEPSRRMNPIGYSDINRLPVSESHTLPPRPRMVRRDSGIMGSVPSSFEQKYESPVVKETPVVDETKVESNVNPEISKPIFDEEQETVTPSKVSKQEFILPKKLGVVGVDYIGLQCMKNLVETLKAEYPDTYSGLELYSLSDESIADRSAQLTSEMMTVSSSLAMLTRDSGISYSQNPAPAKMMSSQSDVLTIISSANDLERYSRKLRLIISNSLKMNPKREIRVYAVSRDKKESDVSLIFELSGLQSQIIPVRIENLDCFDSQFLDTYLRSFETVSSNILSVKPENDFELTWR